MSDRLATHEVLPRDEGNDLFHDQAWIAAVCDGTGARRIDLETTINGEPTLRTTYLERKPAGLLRIAGAPLPGSFMPHMEPTLLRATDDDDIVRALCDQHRYLTAQGCAYLEWGSRSNRLSARTAVEIGGEALASRTFTLDLRRGEEALWNGLDRKCRNIVRKAQRDGVTVADATRDPGAVGRSHEMVRRTLSRAGIVAPHSRSFYEALVRGLVTRGRIRLLVATHDGREIAAGWFANDDREIHYLSGASTPEGYKLGAGNLIQWELLRIATTLKLASYDMGGAGVPAIDRFKASFGGAPHAYGRVVWRSPLGALAEAAYRGIRIARGRLALRGDGKS